MKIDFSSILFQILQISNSGLTRSYFLRKVSTILIDNFRCTEVVQLLKVPTDQSGYELMKFSKRTFINNILNLEELKKNRHFQDADFKNGTGNLWWDIL